MALASLDDIRNFYGLLGTGKDDDLIEDLLDQVSKTIESFCDRTFDSDTYTEYFDGKGSAWLHPTYYPITSVTGIWDDTEWSWGASTEISDSEYRVSNDGRFVLLKNTYFGDFRENIKITYVAGYTTIPNDLKLACIEETVRRYKRRQEVDVTGRTMEDGSTTVMAGDMLPQTKDVLKRYRNKRIV